MRLTSILNGQHFGQLAKLNGIVTYKISPFEQRAFAGAISKGVPNMVRRFRSNVFIVTPPLLAAYLIYDMAEREHKRLLRKNPAEFADDE
ncbi:cytochrome b-c1 complex subunit 8-like [Teleopsis dalmanni]|uniref:cytochrome b-c1 complex subunit 8 n=1 Tax=Teleopsis dalmanni TaxID=139649 RepID=UPI000D32D2D3|nr:cytochrome b-c1 complex subunit 8 [Teleopsis dalmanni]XP_037934922.1 cytochrome b-c1 complex subunit 8-like [Teleopsis dalmanni]